MSCEYVWPLMLMDTSMYLLLAQRRGRGAAQGSLGQDAGDGALVVSGPAAVAVGRDVRGGDLAGLLEELLGRRLADERLLGALDVHRRGADRAARDAGFLDGAALDAECRGRRHDGEVTGTPLDLLVRAAEALVDREAHLDEHLGRLDGRHVRADVELLH